MSPLFSGDRFKFPTGSLFSFVIDFWELSKMSSPPEIGIQQYDAVKHHPPQAAPGTTPTGWLSDAQNRMARKSVSEEHSPLLPRRRSRNEPHKLPEVEMVRDEIEDHKRKLYTFEFMKMLKMSGPVIFAYMLQNSLQTGCILVVGRLVSRGSYWNLTG